MSASVAIVDSGGANIASLEFALRRLGVEATLTNNPDQLEKAQRVILPGVGAAASAMDRLHRHELTESLAQLRCPVLGICLGMQLLAARTEEDDAACLGIAPANIRRLPRRNGFPVPHMGWNRIDIESDDPLLSNIHSGEWFYFVHSFAWPPDDTTLASCEYSERFNAVVRQDNFYGTQFHPERSARAGAMLLSNFMKL